MVVSFYSSFPPFPVNTYIFNKRSGSLRASRESISLSTDLSLSLLPQLKPLCTFFESNFLNRFFHYVVPLCLKKNKKNKKPCKVLSLILRCSAIFHQPFVFSFFYQLLLCLNCSASFSQIRLVFFSFLPLIMLFLRLECLLVQYQLKFTHSPCPPPNPTFLLKTHWPRHLQNYPD